MSEASVPTRLGWLNRRSEALTEMVRFAAWSARRMFSRERLLGTLLLVVVLAATPWVLLYAGAWGWLWIAALAIGAVLFGAMLLISYLKVRKADADGRAHALIGAQSERIATAQGDMSRMMDAMEQRLTTTVADEIGKAGAGQAAALTQALRLNADRLDVMRSEMEARVSGLREEMDARANVFTGALGDLRRAESANRAEMAALVQRAEQSAETRAAEQARATGQLRSELEEWIRSELGTSRAQTAAMGQVIEARLQRERLDHEAIVSSAHEEIQRLVEAQEKSVQATDYLRGLIDRRIRAGAEALRGELDQLRATLEGRLREAVAAHEPAAAKELRDGLEQMAARLAALDGFRAQAEQSLTEQGQYLGVVRQQVRADADELRGLVAQTLESERQGRDEAIRSAVEAEETARKSAIMAVLAEQQKPSSAVEARLADVEAMVEQRTGAAFEARLTEVQGLLDQRMGPEFEARLEAWRARLDNEIASAVQSGRVEDQSAAREREAKLRAELKALHDEMLRQKSEAVSKADVAALSSSVERVGGASEMLEQFSRRLQAMDEEGKAGRAKLAEALSAEARSAAETAVKGMDARVEAVASDVRAEATRLKAAVEEIRKTPPVQGGVKPEAIAKIEERIAEINTRSNVSAQALRRLSDSNASIARPFDRLLAPEKVQKIESHWLKTFGINMSRTALGYMAHKICLLEDRGMGRIAAPIETIVMRQLALRSLPNRGKLEVMEIGNLFGLSAAVLYNFRGARSAGMQLTLIDPLEGYYEAGGADPVTGVEVCEPVLRKNLEDLGVPESDYRLIKALSADPRAITEASDRLYDLILVDGDHSTAGVAADFENYGPLVKPGGLMIFDDYGSDHWPGIQPYVDETVRTDPDWIWIGADYRTAVVAKKADGATARIASKPKAAAGARRAAAKT